MTTNEPEQPRRPGHTTRRALLAGLGTAGLAAAGVGVARVLGALPGDRTDVRASAQTPIPTVTPQPTSTPDDRPVTVAITGDVMLARTIGQHIASSADLFPFTNTASFLRSFDLTIGNLECVVSTLGSPIPGKQFTFEAPRAGFDRLVAAGYRIVSVANNHSGDYGKSAFADMLTHLSEYGITPVGGGLNQVQAHQPVLPMIRTTTIGILAYCDIGPDVFAASDTTPGHAWLTAEALQADIPRARPLCDFLVVFNHWGIEYVTQQNSLQQSLAHTAIDAGADLVVGCHPHVIQPSEVYRGKPIIYSLGNFVFDYMTAPLTSSCQVLTFTVQQNHLLDWKVVHAEMDGDGMPTITG
jgi:poly-gamma-glutamate capsule biosynthesis protein CapA/YwtB (metallophosphatase superfamily)